jgi:Trypsin/PEP-CTERM motif
MPKAVRLGLFFGLLACWSPLNAVVTANSSYDGVVAYNTPVGGVNLDGVVEIESVIGGLTYGCSGSLLSNGSSILTAGHCVDTPSGLASASNVTVSFLGPGGVLIPVAVSNVTVDPAYSVGNSQNGSDLAVLTLSVQAPSSAVEYSLYTGNVSAALNTPLLIAGYGVSGTSGTTGANGTFGTLQAGENEYEGNGQQFFHYSSQLLVGEFYESGDPSTNALGCSPTAYFYACSNASPYTGQDEVDISEGDSGGPTFYDGEIIGVHDLGICEVVQVNGPCTDPPSVNSANNSYFGEMFADTGVGANLTFIEDAEVPEPGTMGMLGFGFTALGAIAWRRRRRFLRFIE